MNTCHFSECNSYLYNKLGTINKGTDFLGSVVQFVTMFVQESFSCGDATIINANSSEEMNLWSHRLGVSRELLQSAIDRAGNAVHEVEDFITAYINYHSAVIFMDEC